MTNLRELGEFLSQLLGSRSSDPFPGLCTDNRVGNLLNTGRVHLFPNFGIGNGTGLRADRLQLSDPYHPGTWRPRNPGPLSERNTEVQF